MQAILPPAMLGILGGGQLGRMFVTAAKRMGYRVTVLDPDAQAPAAEFADVHLCAAYNDAEALRTLAASCAASWRMDGSRAALGNCPPATSSRRRSSIWSASAVGALRSSENTGNLQHPTIS